jgi:glycosyltransferase involved in cell wall biosynthesis
MKIGIDGRCLQNNKNTGVEEYAKSLIIRLLKENNKDEFVIFLNAFGKIKENFEWISKSKRIKIKRFNFPNKLLSLSFWLFNWPKIDKMLGGVDYFISPNFHFMALGSSCKQILSVHDLSFERMPETFSFKRRIWHFLINPRKLSHKAHKIWSVSNSTTQDLINIYKIKPEKIITNYPIFDFGVKNKYKKNIKNKYNLPSRFILFLGTIEPRKNIQGLITGFEIFKKRNPEVRDFKLVIAGEKGWLWESIIQRVKKSAVAEDIVFTGFVREEEKGLLYSLAEIFIYPSFYEGFGFPPLEAMSLGVPTIASNYSSMPEILGEGAFLINPNKPSEICLAIEILLKNEKVYSYYIKKGLQRAEIVKKEKRNFEIN